MFGSDGDGISSDLLITATFIGFPHYQSLIHVRVCIVLHLFMSDHLEYELGHVLGSFVGHSWVVLGYEVTHVLLCSQFTNLAGWRCS